MKKTVSLFIALILAVGMLSACTIVYADELDYRISAYDVSIVVNEDNTLDAVEKITADFSKPKHGIYRYIPVVNHFSVDDKEITAYSRVTNVSANTVIFDKYKDGESYVIQLGDPDIELIGAQNYEISYTLKMGKDFSLNEDELYYNIIGTGWDTSIDNISFSIQMPKSFDSSKISFSTGNYGAEGTDIVSYEVKDNLIVGSVSKALKPYQGVTIQIPLDEGYFTPSWISIYGGYVAIITISVIALIIVLLLWITNGRDKRIKKDVSYYPPSNMNCAEMAYCYKGSISTRDVVPLAIELANEGYLNIEETDEKDSFRFIKRRQYNGSDEIKRKFFNGLFKKKDEVDKSDLEDGFYETVNEIAKLVVDGKKTSIFKEKSLKLRIAGWTISVLSMIINVVIFSATTYGSIQEALILFISVAISLIAFILSFFIRQRTDEGYEIKQQISSFKNFLEESEKDRINAMVNENPSYFYNVLPYAYVLGVSDAWTKKLSEIAVEPPRWYYSHNSVWSYIAFNHFINSTIRETGNAVATPQTNTGSGGGSFGSGGGGFTGGGFGGGGGGSW